MERHGVKWKQLGTKEKHLSVLDFEKKMRAQEVKELSKSATQKEIELEILAEKEARTKDRIDEIVVQLKELENSRSLIELNTAKYDTEHEWQLPEPERMTSAKSYREKKALPLIEKFKQAIKSVVAQYLKLSKEHEGLWRRVSNLQHEVNTLEDRCESLERENNELAADAKNYKRLRERLGAERTDEYLGKKKPPREIWNVGNDAKTKTRGRELEL